MNSLNFPAPFVRRGPTLKRRLESALIASSLGGLAVLCSPAWANVALQEGSSWSGNYRCGAVAGRATLSVTKFEAIAERPSWQRIEATLVFEENGRRGEARFAANNPTRSENFGLSFKEWVQQPGDAEFRSLRLQPIRDAGGVARIGVNAVGRSECIVDGVDTFAFVAEPARPNRSQAARAPDAAQASSTATVPAPNSGSGPAPHDLIPAPAGLDVRAGRPDVPCTARNVAQTEPGLPDADPAQWRRLVPILHAWGNKYYRFTGPGCSVEWAFVIRQWQATVGHPVTGVMTAKDLQALATAVEQSGSSAAVAAARPSAPTGTGGVGVEVFGIRLGAPLSWPRCVLELGVGFTNAPCLQIDRGTVYLAFDRRSAPTMLTSPGGTSSGPTAYFVDGRLERMTFRIHREDEHLQAFEQKFGPATKEAVPMQNNLGAQWTGFIHRWDVAGTTIMVDCTRFERVCGVDIETPVWRQQRQQDKAGRQKL